MNNRIYVTVPAEGRPATEAEMENLFVNPYLGSPGIVDIDVRDGGFALSADTAGFHLRTDAEIEVIDLLREIVKCPSEFMGNTVVRVKVDAKLYVRALELLKSDKGA